MRVYDPRLGRFLSTDPLQKKYPYFTPYQFSGNQPMWAIDLDGLEPYYRTGAKDIPSQYDNSAMQGTIGDYSGLISGHAIEYEKKTYVIFESVHGTRQWYVEYDKDGWKGAPTEFKWYNPGEDKSFHYAMVGMLSTPFAAMGLIEGGYAAGTVVQNFATRMLLKYWASAPAIGKFGMDLAEFFDESNSVGGANTAYFKTGSFTKFGDDMIGGYFKFIGEKSGLERELELGAEITGKGDNLIVEGISYVRDIATKKTLSNDDAKGELSRIGINAVTNLYKKYAKENGFKKLTVKYTRSQGSSSVNPGTKLEKVYDLGE